ncbi:MAG: hypothetical protein WD767_04630 [Alphaproteobacteria bacterium]
MEDLNFADIRRTLEHTGVLSPDMQLSISPIDREMSRLWQITIPDPTGATGRYFVKRVGSSVTRQTISTERQALILKSFEDSFAGVRYFDSLYVGYCKDTAMVVLKKSPLPSLIDNIAGLKPRQALKGYPDLRNGVKLAGRWLRHWHDATRHTGSITEQLDSYVQARPAAFGALPYSTREKIKYMVQSCSNHEIATTHSDFTLFNILSDGSRISVIDPGIWEWTEMSPCWDVCTFLISLEEQTRFRWRNPVLSVPRILDKLKAEFTHAYGDEHLTNSNIYLTCAAVRHSTLFFSCPPGDVKRKMWHRQKLEKHISHFCD